MLNPVREGEEDYIEAIRYRRRLKIFENFLLQLLSVLHAHLLTSIFRHAEQTRWIETYPSQSAGMTLQTCGSL